MSSNLTPSAIIRKKGSSMKAKFFLLVILTGVFVIGCSKYTEVLKEKESITEFIHSHGIDLFQDEFEGYEDFKNVAIELAAKEKINILFDERKVGGRIVTRLDGFKFITKDGIQMETGLKDFLEKILSLKTDGLIESKPVEKVEKKVLTIRTSIEQKLIRKPVEINSIEVQEDLSGKEQASLELVKAELKKQGIALDNVVLMSNVNYRYVVYYTVEKE